MRAELFIAEGCSAKADDLEFFWRPVLSKQVEKRRDEFALRQVAGGAEDDNGSGELFHKRSLVFFLDSVTAKLVA